MAISSTQVTVGTTATLLVTGDHDGCRVLIHKQQQHTIYLGGAGVTTSTGFLFDHDGTIDMALRAGESLYAVCTTGTETAYILTSGN
jgi:hypothetical protein